ncbi:MAG: hypothetical protein QXH24_00590 [Candidatus Bathyarchaeia archaeon]
MVKHDLAFSIFQILHAFYWIMIDMLDALKDAASKANEGLRFHLTLAIKRINIIIEHLKIALEGAGVKLDEREVQRKIDKLSIKMLEDFRNSLKKIVNELVSNRECEISWLSSKLKEIADIIYFASGLLKAYSDSLKKNQDERIWRTCLIIDVIVQDLEVIVNIHRYLTSNAEMLAKDLKQIHSL